ncbi:MAG: PaaI family thioesterase [Deltaproteobacteria bacterium]|nr:PaaI family thioesterase [Deltaproteobacteria bacterium]
MTSNPDLGPREGWTEVQLVQHVLGCKSFVSGDPTGDRLRVRYYRRDEDGSLLGRVWFGPEAEGPPGFVHGGALAAVLDEALGGVAWMSGHPVVSVRLSTKNLRPLPLDSIVTVEARVERVQGSKVYTAGSIFDDAGNKYSEGESLYIELNRNRYGDAIADVEKKFQASMR